MPNIIESMEPKVQESFPLINSNIIGELPDRFNAWDKHFNTINYNRKLVDLRKDVIKFEKKIKKKMRILASGGHDIVIDLFDDEALFYMFDAHPSGDLMFSLDELKCALRDVRNKIGEKVGAMEWQNDQLIDEIVE